MGQLIHRALIGDAHGCNGPHQGQEPVSGRISQNDEAYRRIRSCDRTKIIIWSIFRRSRLMPSEISKVW